MVSDEDLKQFYAAGTKSSADKMSKKFADKAQMAVDKLKSPEVQEGWHQNVSSDAAKKRYAAKVSKLSANDLTEPMRSRGAAAYTRATGDKVTQDKWLRNAKPYIEVAQESSRNKKVVVSEQDAIDNMVSNMQAMKKKFTELNG